MTRSAETPFQLEETIIDDLHQAIREGRTTCVAAVRHYIDRVRAFNGVSSMIMTATAPPSHRPRRHPRQHPDPLPHRDRPGRHPAVRPRPNTRAAARIRPHGAEGAIILAKAVNTEYNGRAGDPGGRHTPAQVLPSTLGYQRSTWAGNPSNHPYDTTRSASLGSSSGSALSVSTKTW